MEKIDGYDYAVSTSGEVKRLATKASGGTGNYERQERTITPHRNNTGYSIVWLYKNGQRKGFLTHRLVAEAFIENPQRLPCVNHKDENPQNNHVDNLEWCTHKYNANYGTSHERIGKKNSKAVLQFDFQGKFIKRYESTMQAQRETGVCNARISESCLGKRKKGGGYIWRYAQ